MKRTLLLALLLTASAAANPGDKAHKWLDTLRQGDAPVREMYCLLSQPLSPELYKKCEDDYLACWAITKKRIDLLQKDSSLAAYPEGVRKALLSASLRQDESAGLVVGLIYMRRRTEKPKEPIAPGPKMAANAPGIWEGLKQEKPPTPLQMTAAKKEAHDFEVKYDVDYKRALSLISDIDAKKAPPKP